MSQRNAIELIRSLSLITLMASGAAAQLASPARPASATARLPQELPQVVLPHPDVERLLAEDLERDNWPFRYGAVLPTSLGLDDAGRWDELPSGELVWRLQITSPGAESLGLVFSEFELPVGGRLFVYDVARTILLGAFTNESRQPNGMFALQPLAGDDLVIEYIQDAGVLARPRLRLGEVVHDYRGILRTLEAAPQALTAACLVDINCPQGNAFQDIKRSVIMVLASGGLCSAGMLNNTAQDGTPYFLTANHCGDMTNVVAVFGYENASCGAGPSSQSNTISGATLLAASTNYDSQLYRLSSSPPLSFEPFFAGWDRAGSQTAPAISISHPSGRPKKIARDNSAARQSGRQWSVNWEVGMLEGGSSGSPLFNGSKRVIGPACCVTDFRCRTQGAFYGRFNGFWVARNLAQWLDPLALGVSFLDGFDPVHAQAIPYFGSGGNPNKYTSTTLPTIGTTWVSAIDTALNPGASSTWIMGHPAPSAGTFITPGELLVDLTTRRVFLSVAPVAGDTSVHSNAIPSDPLLTGAVVYTQGLMLLPGSKVLTNGLALHLR